MGVLRRQIDALAARYELAEGAAHELVAFAGLVDWEETNFLPKSSTGARKRDRGRARKASIASSVLEECLAGLELRPVRQARRIGDLGSGVGFPGLVLAIALPSTHVTLIEAKPERCDYLRETIATLRLGNVDVVDEPAQAWSEGVGACDLITARKVGRPSKVVTLAAPLLAPGGALLLYESRRGRQPGRDAEKDADATAAARTVGLRRVGVHRVSSRKRDKHLHLYVKSSEGEVVGAT
jgi:16S rRNA (guanine(527)-N(7))-methyltransferase RsmG